MSEITLRATSKGHTVEHFHIPKGTQRSTKRVVHILLFINKIRQNR